MTAQQIKIFDTTLRDGQQCPGAGMSFENNIEYAQLAAKVGIDILEAGFPSASKGDFMIVNTIAQAMAEQKNSPIIAALCQLREQQFDISMQSLEPLLSLNKARIHTYLPVDPELMHASLGDYAKQPEKIINDVHRLIKKAADAGFEVEFSPEGYSRMGKNFSFVTEVIRAAISAGATIINCPDTIGGACRLQGAEYFVTKMQTHADMMRNEFPGKDIVWSVHCHNDFGLALENTMNAVLNGPATQIEGCFNGIGERAGNVALEQCIMYLKHFGELGSHGKSFFTNANTEALQSISDFISRYMLQRQAHWPITGENAAKHSSGGHTNAVISNPLAYQPFDPRETGQEISFSFGPLSGSNHAKAVIEKFGYSCDEDEKTKIAQYIKDYYADRRKGVTDQELLNAYLHYRMPIKVTEFEYTKSAAENSLKITGKFFSHEKSFTIKNHSGGSALSALHEAINKFMDKITIENYHSQSVNKGIDSISQSKIIINDKHKNIYTGLGEDQDIEISALKALISAVNQAYIHQYLKQEI